LILRSKRDTITDMNRGGRGAAMVTGVVRLKRSRGDSGAVEKAPIKPLCTITWNFRPLQRQDLESGELHVSSTRDTFSTAPLSPFITVYQPGPKPHTPRPRRHGRLLGHEFAATQVHRVLARVQRVIGNNAIST